MGSGKDTIGPAFDDLISAVRALVHDNDAGLVETFDVYAQEARFSRTVFDEDFRLSLIHISEPTRPTATSRMPSSA